MSLAKPNKNTKILEYDALQTESINDLDSKLNTTIKEVNLRSWNGVKYFSSNELYVVPFDQENVKMWSITTIEWYATGAGGVGSFSSGKCMLGYSSNGGKQIIFQEKSSSHAITFELSSSGYLRVKNGTNFDMFFAWRAITN